MLARTSVALLSVLVLACAEPSRDDGPIRVGAAASLTDVLPEIAGAFERGEGATVEARFGPSSTLARQIVEGAPTDVFISADPRWVQSLVDARLADAGARRRIATNRLVVIVPQDAPGAPRDLAALARVAHLAVAGPEVPAGMHARTALERSGILAEVRARFVEAADVRAALAWVARGEAEAGIVYATDARVEPRVRVAFEVPLEIHEPIVIEAISLAGAREDGAEFVQFLGRDEVRRALAAAGFGP